MPIASDLAWRGLLTFTGLPSISIVPVAPITVPNSASSSCFCPCPSRPPSPTTSPGRTSRSMPLSRPPHDRSLTLSTGAARARLGRARREDVRIFAADHQLDDRVVGLRAGGEGLDVAAVAEHRAVVGQLGDLVHAVRDVDDRHALRLELLEQREDLGDVGGRQRRGRFVEDQNLRDCATSALAISTICRRDSGRSPTGAFGWMSSAPTRASSRLGDPPLRAPVDQARRRAAAR